MIDPQYAATVENSFITKPLRTVLMIDDAFPTYSDLSAGSGTHAQKDRAAGLYAGFRNLHMLCDIENSVDEVNADHLRKSDLVVLDYHLVPGTEDEAKSIQLLRTLASSHHFNTVVVYTSKPEQDEVWLKVIASLSGGWSAITARLDGEPKEHWEKLSDSDKLPQPAKDAIMQFARSARFRGLEEATQKVAVDELTALGVPAAHCAKIIEYLVAQELAGLAGDYAALPSQHAVGNYADGTRWIQVGNAFVVIMHKTSSLKPEEEAQAILDALKSALLSWRPSVIQVLISEIQNALELEGLAGSDAFLRRPDAQTALTYYLLSGLGPLDMTKDVDVRVPLMRLVDNVVDGLRRRLSSLDTLFEQVEGALKGDLRSTGWTLETWPEGGKLLTAASKFARMTDVKNNDVMFRLNNFLTTETFRRAHLTTGTIVHDSARGEHFAVASPACDLVAGQPNGMQLWSAAIRPMLPVVVVHLQPEPNVDQALSNATNGQYVFLYIGDEPEAKAFKVESGVGHQPSYELIFARDEGRVRDEGGKKLFDGARFARTAKASSELPADGTAEHESGCREEVGAEALPAGAAKEEEPASAPLPPDHALVDGTFEVVGQLRGVNATHILQLVGHHLSRVGLDFVGTPRK